MTQIQQNIPLRQYNTLGIDAIARYFAAFTSVNELSELIEKDPIPGKTPFIVGGGSNILFKNNVNALVLKNDLPGLEIIKEDADHVYIKAGAGEVWHGFVQFCLQHNWAGVENLSLIPGCVGASPMQNIGAYGVEIKEVFESLEAWHLHEKKIHVFSASDCEFGYRESVFKGKYKNQYVILNVTYRLNKKPRFNTSYGAIEQELERMGVQELSIQAVSQAVINIRTSKLPDPAKIGNAGSFFKNPSVAAATFEQLKKQYPNIVGYPNTDGTIKLAAGWLIEQSGLKGFRRGDAGVHERQALVLVNYGHATGKDIYDLSEDVMKSVYEKFGVSLEREVNVV
ncbi:UDP-N-acetylenolpyruvoylglucosamine reductase [Niastella vici]|uniref:UDP-N-acetylenolpyruvoylglucosamine reductase n=1 Tax=Niastella vici TaxID=1703345 RepID=A0A1V9FHR8_9BACT|nr:UDP-N-acetylmuramate dehydrogenase [Niastella vici]OQP57811.1 UDP-N-acetylenolpyruvoylglucosamine reductase [Niastella vici]